MFMIFMAISLMLVGVVGMLFYFLSYKVMMDFGGVSGYECGFDLISTARVAFSYRFFLMAILFLIFDVEIVLLLPTPFLSLGWLFYFFILILGAGLFYEIFCGAIDWL